MYCSNSGILSSSDGMGVSKLFVMKELDLITRFLSEEIAFVSVLGFRNRSDELSTITPVRLAESVWGRLKDYFDRSWSRHQYLSR